MPAKAGIQDGGLGVLLDSRFRGNDELQARADFLCKEDNTLTPGQI